MPHNDWKPFLINDAEDDLHLMPMKGDDKMILDISTGWIEQNNTKTKTKYIKTDLEIQCKIIFLK
jgi:hypothetical protein